MSSLEPRTEKAPIRTDSGNSRNLRFSNILISNTPESDESAQAIRTGGGPGDSPLGGLSLVGARPQPRRSRLRTDYLPDLSGDHAFSMLLELYAARLEARRIPQTRLGESAGVPHATAIRIVQALAVERLVDTTTDPADRRLNLIALTDEGVERMEAYLQAALAAGAPLV